MANDNETIAVTKEQKRKAYLKEYMATRRRDKEFRNNLREFSGICLPLPPIPEPNSNRNETVCQFSKPCANPKETVCNFPKPKSIVAGRLFAFFPVLGLTPWKLLPYLELAPGKLLARFPNLDELH